MSEAIGRSADAATTLAMRREIYSKDAVTRDDFLRLLAAGRAAGAGAPPEFDRLLAEVAADLLVRQAHPPKYISQADAGWLISVLAAGSGLSWRAEREMLVALTREAASIPPSLSDFIMSQFERVVVSGHMAASGADHAAGVMTPDDLEALRNVIFAATEGSALYVTREEAEALFRIARATEGAQNAPGFDEFFAKAVGNYLMGVVFDRAMTPAAAAHTEKWLNAPAPSLSDFVAAMLDWDESATKGLRQSLASVEDRAEAFYKADNEEDAIEMARAEKIDAAELKWLATHLGRAGALTGAEKALLYFLKQEAPEASASIDALIAAKAA